MVDVDWLLLVEDDPDHRVLLEEVLRRHWPDLGFHDRPDVAAATRWLRERKADAGLDRGVLVVDVGLGGSSGFHLLEWMDDVDVEVPAVVLTASRNAMDAEHAFHLGAAGYFEKPADVGDYVDLLRQVLEPEPRNDADEGGSRGG